jgi:hypothetical protein
VHPPIPEGGITRWLRSKPAAATLPRFATSAWPISCGPTTGSGLNRCKGWLRLEFVFDLLHQGKARVESPAHHLLILPFIGVKPDERVEQALLRFAQTADREFAVENGEGRLIGTLALLDLVLAEEGGR